MYDAMQQNLLWINIANIIYLIVEKRFSSKLNRRINKEERRLLLFNSAESLNFVAVDILGLYQRPKEEVRSLS